MSCSRHEMMVETAPPSRLNLRTAAPALLAASAGAAAIWAAAFGLLPPLSGMTAPELRLLFAIKCAAISLLFTLVLGIEAVAHERLLSDAFDPLAGRETKRLRINQRFIQNTLEQSVLFLAGLLALSFYCASGSSMRAVVACTVVWTLSRLVFWVGYHIAPEHRVAGLIGTAQSLAVLIYVCVSFGYEIAGVIGATAPLALFFIAEGAIFIAVKRR